VIWRSVINSKEQYAGNFESAVEISTSREMYGALRFYEKSK